MLHDKCTSNGARLQPLAYVIIPKEIRTLPKIKYTPKRELTRLNAIKISTAPEPSPSSSSANITSVSSPAVSHTRSPSSSGPAAKVGDTEKLSAEIERLRAENETLKEENEKMARQVRLVKLTLQNEVQDNTRLREKLRQLGHQDEESDSDE